MRKSSPARLPLALGDAYFEVFQGEVESRERETAVAIYFCERGELGNRIPPVRVHSSCLPSEAFGARDCDCAGQLKSALEIVQAERGVLIYLFQEGRGAGILAKFLGIELSQTQGLTTYSAYEKLGLDHDLRQYDVVRPILESLGIGRICLLTNNPLKARRLAESGIQIANVKSVHGLLTPSNFDYLTTKCLEGGHALETILPARGDNSFSFFQERTRDVRQFVIFDGDDTLWEDNYYYEIFIEQLIDAAVVAQGGSDRKALRGLIDDAELEIIPGSGFGPVGFQQSLRLAHEKMQRQVGDFSMPQDFFDKVLTTLLAVPYELIDGAEKTILELRKMGAGLALYTKGLPDIQARKLRNARICHRFEAISLVRDKNKENLARFLDELRHRFGAEEFTYVGNSLRSDILPAISNGIRAIYYFNQNTWHMDDISTVDPDSYMRITRLNEIAALVGKAAAADRKVAS